MAISYRGTITTRPIIGNDALTQNLFVISNGYKSGVNIIIRKLSLMVDSIAVLTSVQPVAKVSRATTISGGIILDKGGLDTSLTSDTDVTFRSALYESAVVTATPGNIIWSTNIRRMHTAVEQQQCYEFDLLPPLVKKSAYQFLLRPNQNLLVQIVASAINVNQALITNSVVSCAWEEDPIATFAISGTVTLSGSPVEGAEVMVIEADDTDGTNAYLREVKTTPVGGTWASTIRTGKVGFAHCSYKTGGTEYSSTGKPFLDDT